MQNQNPLKKILKEVLQTEVKKKTASVSAKLKSLNLNIDEIWHSTKKRSRETAEILTSLNNLKKSDF